MHFLSLKGFARTSYDKYWRYRLCKERKKFQAVFFSVIQVQRLSQLKHLGILFGQEKIGKKVITWRHMHNVAKLSQRKIQFRNLDTASFLFNNSKYKSFTIKIRPISRANCVKCRVFVVLCYHYWKDPLYVMISSFVDTIRKIECTSVPFHRFSQSYSWTFKNFLISSGIVYRMRIAKL